MLEPDTFDRIPKDVSYSIERAYFPSLIERSETFVAYVDRGYWIDIGTPEKYVQVHRDMFDGKFAGGLFATADRTKPIVSPEARIEDGATIDGALLHRRRRARQGRRHDRRLHGASAAASWSRKSADLQDTIVWPNTRIGQNAVVARPDHRPQLPHRPRRRRSRGASCSATRRS